MGSLTHRPENTYFTSATINTGLIIGSHNGKANHHAQMCGFCNTLKNAVCHKSYVEKGDLAPGEPQKAEEADV